jgi:hypothetical protein
MPLQYLREWQSSLHLRRGNSWLSWLRQSEATKVQLLEAISEDFGSGSRRRVGSSERETATIRLAAALTVQGRIARDERVAGEGLTRVLNAQARALRELRLMRHRTPLRV